VVTIPGLEFSSERQGVVLVDVKFEGKVYPFALHDPESNSLVLLGADGKSTPVDLNRKWLVQIDEGGEKANWLVGKSKSEFFTEAEAVETARALTVKFPGRVCRPRKFWGQEEVY
jgi:hypothetical protein